MQGNVVERVEPGSIAEEIGLCPGDQVLLINGNEPGDILDWRLAESSDDLLLTVQQLNGELVEYEIEKDYDESLGIVFSIPTLDCITPCQNRCIFCFVDQLPRRMRESLYVKDDDYRLSFLSGSYVTLTNLSEHDLQRIIGLHLSPLYISIHTTDPVLRQRMLNHRNAGEVMNILNRLAGEGITFHCQVVLCPGLNDGAQLDRTICDLYGLYPAATSLAVVPVGLTGYRQGLYPLSPFDSELAAHVLRQVERWQDRCLEEQGSRFVFASDEFYTLAGCEIPPDDAYEGYPQLENGVGLVRLLYNEWEVWQDKLPRELPRHVNATVATGLSAAVYLKPVIDRLNMIGNLTVDLVAVNNRFFGGRVSVAGLLTYEDLFAALRDSGTAGPLFLPRVVCREGTDLFLDGGTVSELSRQLCRKVHLVAGLEEFLRELF